MLNRHHIDTSIITGVNKTARGNEYNLHYEDIDEKVIVKNIEDGNVTIISSDGEKSNVITFAKDGSIILDGYKVQISQVEHMDTDITAEPLGRAWKSVKSLSPYGSLRSSDYNKYLSSGKQNIRLGKAINSLTITSLAVVISTLNPFAGITVSLAGVARNVYNVIVSINPRTEYLGCKYTTYTAGSSDYKYINKFYANRECRGKYRTELSYEHFIVY